MNDKLQNAYLLKHYGITLAEKQAIIALQEQKCSVCGLPFTEGVRTEVDHEHIKVLSAIRSELGWTATTQFRSWWAKTKAEAIRGAKKASLRFSVRGVLCGGRYKGCNKKMGRVDNAKWLQNASIYISNPPAHKILFDNPSQS